MCCRSSSKPFVAVTVPILQIMAALAVLSTGGVLYLFGQNQKDLVQIIISSVALVFILEIDNRVGYILSLRGRWLVRCMMWWLHLHLSVCR